MIPSLSVEKVSAKALEDYLQEAAAATFGDRLSDETKCRIAAFVGIFRISLANLFSFVLAFFIPEAVWPRLW